MSRKLGHPHLVTLASLQAGLSDPRRSGRLSAHVAQCPRCAHLSAQLSEISAILWAAPEPSAPIAAERRVLAALALEAGARARRSREPWGAGRVRHWCQPFRALPRPRVLAPAAACLLALCATIGYVASGMDDRASSRHVALTAARPATMHRGVPPVAFLVTRTDTRYQKSTLLTQVREQLTAQLSGPSVEPVPDSASPRIIARSPASLAPGALGAGTSPTVLVAPSSSLVGCVLHLTGNVQPAFVDRATYQSEPAYVIADLSKAWVVGTDCTAARPSVITSVPLTTAS
jgi:hypothetical protein